MSRSILAKKSQKVKEIPRITQTWAGYYITDTGCRGNSGNSKVGKDTVCINMGSAKNCISKRKGYCQLFEFNKRMQELGLPEQGECFGDRDERVYPGCLPAHLDQEAYWIKTPPSQKLQDILDLTSFHIERNPGFQRYFIRPSIVHDFRSQRDIDLWHEAAQINFKRHRAVAYTYTARKDLSYVNVDPSVFVIKSSGSVDFTGMGRFMIIGKKELVPEGWLECPGKKTGCQPCSYCKVPGLDIVNRNHANRKRKGR